MVDGASAAQTMPVVVLAYDGVAADEAGIVIEILSDAGCRVLVAAVDTAAARITSFHGTVRPSMTAEQIGPCAALVVPGGMGVKTAAANDRLTAVIHRLGTGSTWLGATSTGSVLLAAAGLADGARATTHWLAQDLLNERGIVAVDAPFVEHGRLLTASGLGSSPTLAFRLVAALRGVEAEARSRARYAPSPKPPSTTGRRRPRRWSMRRSRHRIVDEPVYLTMADDVIVLDLWAEHPTTSGPYPEHP